MRPPRLAELAARGDRLVRIAALCAAAWAAFACVYVMFGRLGHPYELEWMTGAILDHIERIGHGEPIYAAPTASWIPFLYPPLYYWVSAQVAKVLPLTIACRSVSIVSAFVQAACVWRLARRRRATRFWSALGVGAFFAAFAIVDYWYDLERPDALFVALVMIGCLALEESRGVVGATLAGLVVGSAFFVKQPAAVFLLGGSFALVVRREWARTAAFAIAGGAVIVVFVSRLQAETSGWFGYYVLAMPRAHGVSWSLVPGFVFGDLPHAWAWTVATAALAIAFFARRGRQTDDAVFACFVVSSFVASASSRLHIGGWSNVLSFWTAFGAAAIAVVGTRAEGFVRAKGQSLATAGAALLPGLFVVQILATAYVPADRVPTRASVPRFAALVDRIRALEQRGEVIVFGRGHLTTARHFHIAALIDVITVEHRLPDDVVRAFRERRFAAIVIDDFADLWIPLHPEIKGELFKVVTAGYYVAERVDDRVPVPIVGWPARPTWILLPRAQPLDETDRTLLERRSRAELQIAQMREEAERRGTAFPQHSETTETIAKALCDRTFESAVDPAPTLEGE